MENGTDTSDMMGWEYVQELDLAMQLHIYLLAGAWYIVFPVATLIPLCKRNSESRTWVYFYVLLMLIGLGATGAGLYFVFDYKQDMGLSHLKSAHAIVGGCTTASALFVSFVGFLPKGDKTRALWKATMLWFGRLTLILGFTSLILAFKSLQEWYGENKHAQIAHFATIGVLCLGAIVVGCVGFCKSSATGVTPEGGRRDSKFRFSTKSLPSRAAYFLRPKSTRTGSSLQEVYNVGAPKELQVSMPNPAFSTSTNPTFSNGVTLSRKPSMNRGPPPTPPPRPISLNDVPPPPPEDR